MGINLVIVHRLSFCDGCCIISLFEIVQQDESD